MRSVNDPESRRSATRCPARLAIAALLLVAHASPGVAQQPTPKTAADDAARRERVAKAAEAWVASDQTSRELLDATLAELLREPEVGFAWLAAAMPAVREQPTEPRSKGVSALVTHGSLEFLRRESSSGVVFAGQYERLRVLQPEVGELFFGLLLDTPAWYPETHRVQLVPPLRDLFPKPPPRELVDRILAVAEHAAIEPEDLRDALACMLWQWGRRELAQARLEALLAASSDGDAEDRVPRLLALADLHYQLRDYRAAANVHLGLQSLAETTRVPLKPNDYYAAACVHALCGNLERGMAALTKSIDLHASPNTDSSLRLDKVLLDRDPEIALLRGDPRFPALLARAFPPEPPREPR
jgi:hypothetical protein